MLRILFFLLFSVSVSAQVCDKSVSEAHEVVGKEMTICGKVYQVTKPQGIRGNPTYINMGARYPNHSFTVVIWGQDAMEFPMGALKAFEGKQIVVTGLVEEYRGKPQIIVKDVEQIEVIE